MRRVDQGEWWSEGDLGSKIQLRRKWLWWPRLGPTALWSTPTPSLMVLRPYGILSVEFLKNRLLTSQITLLVVVVTVVLVGAVVDRDADPQE